MLSRLTIGAFMHIRRLLILPALMLLAVGCAGSASLQLAGRPTPIVVEDRKDCDAILDTAFRSERERAWFVENCSAWPVAQEPIGRPGVTQDRGNQRQSAQQRRSEEPPDCQRIRGRPYESDSQRTWFLQNCVTGGAAPSGEGPDRTNCAEIYGTQYRSASERTWFLQNCAGGTATQASTGPDRTNCNEIYGTPYRSANERTWFLQNCVTGGPRPSGDGPDRTNCAEIAGSLYRSETERVWFLQNCLR
jgi:hypothetical protein